MRLGSYEVVRKLARGGMAELFLARTVGPEGFEKLVVLKKILPTHAENPKFVRLFLDEAKLAATLDHPNIAHVYDMGKVDGNYFFAMEYVHGQDVRTTMRRTTRLDHQFPIDHAVQIARNVAAALHYAHERTRGDGSLLDIVHRDVSPSNILVSYDGAVKLVDFGVAKAATSTVKTRTGTLKGKIAYMSPEQAKGAPIDRRSDIFSLGIVLWEMVTSNRLYRAENDLATIQMIINSKAQPPTQLRPECPPELERIVLRALSVELDQRYQTAEQLQLDLEELAREQKLKQSTVALRAYMHELFEDEINQWSAAQASGQTLTEHMVEKAAEMTTPVSESEIYSLDDGFDDAEEDHPSETTGAPTLSTIAPTMEISVPPPPAQPRTRSRDINPSEPLLPDQAGVIPVNDQTPTMHDLPPAAAVLVEMDRNMRSQPTPSPFPIAPREWRPSQIESTVNLPFDEGRRKKQIIGVSIGFGLVVLLVIAFATRDPRPAAARAAAPESAEMPPGPTVQMTPTPVEPQPPAEQPPEQQPPAQQEVAPPSEPTPPAEAEPKTKKKKSATKPVEKPATTKPAVTTTKSVEKPPVTKPVTTTKPPVTTKPAEKPPVTKPAVPPKPDKKPYDPNSAIAPT